MELSSRVGELRVEPVWNAACRGMPSPATFKRPCFVSKYNDCWRRYDNRGWVGRADVSARVAHRGYSAVAGDVQYRRYVLARAAVGRRGRRDESGVPAHLPVALGRRRV